MTKEIPYSYDDYQLSNYEEIRYYAVSGTAFFIIAYIFYQSFILSLLFTTVTYPCIRIYKNYLIDKRKRELSEQFRDALYSLSSSISTGRSLSQALKEAHENLKLIYKEDGILLKELSQMIYRIFESRESEEEVLKDFARRSCVEDIETFIDIYFICRSTGGDLVKVVSKSSEMMMDKMTIKKEIATLTAQKRFEAKLLTAMPILVLLFLQMASPEYMQIMYVTFQGRVLMTIALLSIISAYLWSMKLTRIQV
ncbi:MAG: type II secretion system F family protein [Anaerovoracaceae bacterium]|jgi:tight adherence protein B